MTTSVTERLAEIRAYVDAATDGPWWFDESENCWRLHGVMGRIPAQLSGRIPEQIMNKQILKAPKHGTPYAEYWPDPADAELIVKARTDLPALLAAVEAVLGHHRKHDCTRDGSCLCGEDQDYCCCGDPWPCITRELVQVALTPDTTAAETATKED
jgi:hypothetical protein